MTAKCKICGFDSHDHFDKWHNDNPPAGLCKKFQAEDEIQHPQTLSDKICECQCNMTWVGIDDVREFIKKLKEEIFDEYMDNDYPKGTSKFHNKVKKTIDKLAGEDLI